MTSLYAAARTWPTDCTSAGAMGLSCKRAPLVRSFKWNRRGDSISPARGFRIRSRPMATRAQSKLASAMSRLGTETAFSVLARARQLEAKGKSVIHLEIGEPDFDTPSNIIDAGVKALRSGFTHYGPSHGLPQLREAIAENVAKTRGVEASPTEVLVTPGAKPIMFFTILALCEPGDEVIYPDPGFPIYESMVSFVGAKPVPAPLLPENEFRVDLDQLEGLISDRTKLLIVNSPQNPTGGVLLRQDIEAIAELVRDRGIFVLTDEVYKDIMYGD